MISYFKTVIAIFCLLAVSSCYTDDSSGPNPDRLPFEDFTEFFNDNNAQSDTLVVDIGQNAQAITSEGIKINIPEDAFSVNSGNVSLEIKEITKKSDFLFLNKPTLDGNTIIESQEALFFKPFTSSGELTILNPLNIQMSLPSGTNAEELDYYYYQNDWSKDSDVEVEADGNAISFESTRAKWQMAGKELDVSGNAQLSITPSGYGTIPHDMRAFAIGTQNNILLPLDFDVANVSASGSLPKGIEFNIVLMTMDHFTLSYGSSAPITLSGDMDINLQMEIVTVEEMINEIKSLD